MKTIILIHVICATVFLVDYLVKTILLLSTSIPALEKYKKLSKIPSMIISTGFLVSGVYIISKIGMGNIGGWFHLKLTLIAIGLILGIIGFKKNSKWMAVTSLILFFYIYGISETKDATMGLNKPNMSGVITDVNNPAYDTIAHGQMIYTTECVRCHGKDGDAGLYGAPKLTGSICENRGLIGTIKSGRNMMPPFKDKLSEQEILAVAEYVKSLRK